MKLSYREKIILMIVVAVMTLAVGFFVAIKPKINTISQSKTLLTQKQSEKLAVDEKIKTAEAITKKLKDTYDEDKKLSEFFMPEVNTYEVDQFLSEKLEQNNIKVTGLDLTAMKETDLAFYAPEGKHPVYALQVAADLNGTLPSGYLDSANQTGVNKTCEKAALSVAKISFVASFDDFKAFLDTIDSLDKSVIVSELDIKDATLPVVEGTITINLYSLSELPEMK